MDPLIITLLLVVGFIAGFFGATTGGAGLITIPSLIFLGAPPQTAIATTKFGGLGMNTIGFYKFHKHKKINYRIGIPIAIISLVGAYIGANTLLKIPNEILSKIIGVLIMLILIIIITNKNLGIKKIKTNKPFKLAGYASFLLIGFWGAFFGAGVAIFATYALVLLFGERFLESSGTRKIAELGIALVAIVIFGITGIINWSHGVVLLIGMSTGSYVGAGYGIKKGDKWFKALFIIIVTASAIKLFL